MITKEQARAWAEYLLGEMVRDPDFSLVYEDEDLTEDYPDEDDWRAIHDEMLAAKVEVSWDE